jgi:hypothetical protein
MSIVKRQKRESQNLIGYNTNTDDTALRTTSLKRRKGVQDSSASGERLSPAILGLAEVTEIEGDSEEAVNLLEKAYEDTHSTIISPDWKTCSSAWENLKTDQNLITASLKTDRPCDKVFLEALLQTGDGRRCL